jgi:hypothetical protein
MAFHDIVAYPKKIKPCGEFSVLLDLHIKFMHLDNAKRPSASSGLERQEFKFESDFRGALIGIRGASAPAVLKS